VILQGVLGFLLFNVFAGDLCISITHSTYLFADETGTVCIIMLAFDGLALILFTVGVTNMTET
jgi:hypothetical protein